jgi:hypothetical protein
MNTRDEMQLWLARLSERSDLSEEDRDELESHLHDSMDRLIDGGLNEDEALLIALRRLGNLDELVAAQVRKEADRIWKGSYRTSQTTTGEVGTGEGFFHRNRDSLLIAGSFIAIALASLLPGMLGRGIIDGSPAYFLNAGTLVLPIAGAFYVIRRWFRGTSPGWRLLAPFLMLLFPLLLNVYPFGMEGQTLLLSILHMPLGMWLAFSLLRDSSVYRDADARLDFIRFSGEVTVYSVLIGLAAIALSVLGLALFSFVEVDIEEFLAGWVLPVILPGTLFAGIVLVERKRSLVENFAPILARIVSIPLLLILLTFGLFFIPRSGSLESAREILIAMDVLLLGVIVVVIYSISTRGDLAAGKTQDMVNLLLVLSAIVLDIFVLIAMVYRLAEYGMSANKLASLGSNILLLGNLSLLALYFISQLRSGLSAGKILSAQGWYFGLYAAWFYLVALGFPLIFRFA